MSESLDAFLAAGVWQLDPAECSPQSLRALEGYVKSEG